MSTQTRRGSLRWAVKPSFVRYVRTIAAGSCEAVSGAQEDPDGTFVFPLAEASESTDGWVLSFGGSVRFSAHHGFLDVDLRDPVLAVAPGGAELSIATAEGGRVVIATADPVAPAERAGPARWEGLVPRLTEAGVEVFGNAYPLGSELAPLDAFLLLD